MLGTNKKTARIAGALYLAHIVASLLATQFGRYHFSEAAVAVSNLAADPMGLRIGFVIEMFGAVLLLLAGFAAIAAVCCAISAIDSSSTIVTASKFPQGLQGMPFVPWLTIKGFAGPVSRAERAS